MADQNLQRLCTMWLQCIARFQTQKAIANILLIVNEYYTIFVLKSFKCYHLDIVICKKPQKHKQNKKKKNKTN